MPETALQPKEQRTARDGPEVTRSVCFTPRVDIRESDDEVTVYADMPGVWPGDVDVRFENGELSICGCCRQRQAQADYLRCEYGIGDFYRTFAVSELIDPDRITAEHKNGVLTVHLPKAAAAKPKRITVQTQ